MSTINIIDNVISRGSKIEQDGVFCIWKASVSVRGTAVRITAKVRFIKIGISRLTASDYSRKLEVYCVNCIRVILSFN